MAIILLSILFLFIIYFLLMIKDKIRYGHASEHKCYLLAVYIVSLVIPTQYPILELSLSKQAASFGDIIYIATWDILIILIYISSSKNVKTKTGNSIKWLIVFTLISDCSYFNPYNANPAATIVGIYYMFSLLLSSIIIYRRFNFDELLFAIRNAFIIIVIIELVLAIAYPVLNIDAVTSIFHGVAGMDNAGRGDRPSAVGTFSHPGQLGVMMSFIFTFFTANYFYANQKLKALIYMILSGVIIILTQSRMSYIVAIMALLFIYIFHNPINVAKIIKYSLTGIIFFITIAYLIVFQTAMGAELFLSDNFTSMIITRLIHWNIGWEVFTDNMVFGTGLNAHLSYMNDNISFIGQKLVESTEFYETNPIHNTHLIVLCELGIIGGLVWFYGLFSSLKTNIRTLVKLNAILPVNSSSICINFAISQIFAGSVILVYSIYGLTGWATTRYYSLSFLILSIILSEKCRSEHSEIIV